VVMSVALPMPAGAWGAKGHAWVSENAVKLLPEGELRERMERELPSVVGYSSAPDFELKDGINESLEAPNHYIDLDAPEPMLTAEVLRTELRSRVDAARWYTAHRLTFRDGGFLPWRIEEMEVALANAMAGETQEVGLFAGLLAHYAADATQPLHTTKDYNGRVAPNTKESYLHGIHADYEIVFIQDRGIEFRESSLAMARPAKKLDDVFGAAVDMVLDSYTHVDMIYDVAGRNAGPDRYTAWDAEMGEMTRERLAEAATLVASLWLTAWEEAQQAKAARPER